MNRLQEIELRLSAIKTEIDGDGADLNAIETEINALKEERTALLVKVEKRKQLIDIVVADGKIIKEFYDEAEERKMEFNKENVMGSTEYRSAYLKTLQGKPLDEVEQRAYSTAAGTGAEVIPTITANKVMTKVFEIAPVLEHMTNLFHVPGNLKWAVEATNNDAAIHTENGAITPASDTLTEISLSAYEVTKALRVSRTVSAMSIDAFEGFLVQLLADNLAKKLESLVFTGTGSSQATGLVKAGSGASGVYVDNTDQVSIAVGATVAEADVLAWYGMIGNYPNAKAYMSKATFLAYFYPIMNVGKNISVKNINGQFYVMDAPVFFTSTLTKGIAYMASLDQLVGNFAEDINVRKSTESGFLNNSIDYLAVCAFDCKPIVGNSAFAKFVKAQS